MNNFLTKLEELLDTEKKLNGDVMLTDLEEWDSLSFVSFIAFANTAYGKHISPEALRNAQTVNDLFALVS